MAMRIWVANLDGNIYLIDETGKVEGKVAVPSRRACGVGVDGEGKLWYADPMEARIYRIDPETGSIITSFDAPGRDPWAIAVKGERVFSSDIETDKIYKHDFSGRVLDSFPGTPRPSGLGIALDGNFWVSDSRTRPRRIVKMDAEGNTIKSFDAPTVVPSGIGVDPEGNIWHAEGGGPTPYKMYKLTPDGEVLKSFAGPGEGELRGVAVEKKPPKKIMGIPAWQIAVGIGVGTAIGGGIWYAGREAGWW